MSQLFESLSDRCERDERLTEIESLCMSCGANGVTLVLLTRIPHFREVVLMSFSCPHCGHRNNELQSAQTIDERAVRYALHCSAPQDLSRLIVKTEWAEIEIPEIEFEVKKQTGLITTVEGIIDRAIEGLQQTLNGIQIEDNGDADSATKLSQFLIKLKELREGNKNFTFVVNDISGNSFVENPLAPLTDPNLEIVRYKRSAEQDKLLGIYEPESNSSLDDVNDEVLQFPTNCSNCNAPCFTNMKLMQIPHFKQIVIMATNCDACGHKTNEVKSGAGIEDKGVKIVFKVNDESDLKKEVIKSDTCNVSIPELDINVSSISGRYTTIEGLAENIKEELRKTNPFIDGDSSKQEIREKLNTLFDKLSNLIGYTIILDDPCGNSYIEGISDIIKYERSWRQNEELGLNDIKTENYATKS